ncbi:MAG: hypothetical protein JXX29_01150 [Deltaproteobacteria bacterium]|nr:hypothetical protein [Deltaproteobacteria bacterium]MBN2670245.1 hypothetical protein [Deltaproteobacteria bacterium]
MKSTILIPLTIFFLFSLLFGCDTHVPDKKNPEGAFIRLAQCIDTASTNCLFWEIDTETRWSVSSVHKLLSQIRSQVEKSYPKDQMLRDSVYGKWKFAADAETAQEMFHRMCEETQCLQELAKGFGAVKTVTREGNTATVETMRGKRFPLRRTKGKWGLVLFEEKLNGEKIRLSDSLKQVKRNAAEYEQQRLATGRN